VILYLPLSDHTRLVPPATINFSTFVRASPRRLDFTTPCQAAFLITCSHHGYSPMFAALTGRIVARMANNARDY
jgi:hypothetical protein